MRVLLIDDNEDVTEAVSDYLEGIGDSCRTVSDGRQGLEIIKKEGHNYDAIILDLAMPEFSGYDVLESLKNEGLLESNNIILFTASSIVDKDVEELMSIGVKTILRKPLSLEHLEETINRFRH
jgi:CheY-like chemotaxis protein